MRISNKWRLGIHFILHSSFHFYHEVMRLNFNLKIEAVCASEAFVSTYKFTRCYKNTNIDLNLVLSVSFVDSYNRLYLKEFSLQIPL